MRESYRIQFHVVEIKCMSFMYMINRKIFELKLFKIEMGCFRSKHKPNSNDITVESIPTQTDDKEDEDDVNLWLYKKKKSAVHGYIRQNCEWEFPIVLMELCLVYYYREKDEWNTDISNGLINIQNDTLTTPKYIGDFYRLAFGSKIIQAKQKNIWKFELKAIDHLTERWTAIGIKEHDKIKGPHPSIYFEFYGTQTIEMELNMLSDKQGQLIFDQYKILHVDLSKKYRLCVGLCQNSQLTLIV
eukprot:346969_1